MKFDGWMKAYDKSASESKKSKKDVFTNDALILEDAVGGDLSAPSCSNARLDSLFS